MREHDEKEHDQKHAGPQNAYECESAIQVNEDTARRPGVEAEADMERLRARMTTRRGGDGGASAKNAAQAKARHVGSWGTGKEEALHGRQGWATTARTKGEAEASGTAAERRRRVRSLSARRRAGDDVGEAEISYVVQPK